MSRLKTLASATALLAALLLPTIGYADVILPEEEVCDGKAKGDACELEDGSMGTCADGERCRPLPDMGQDCTPTLVCEAAAGNNSAGNNTTANNSAGNNTAANNSAGNNSAGNNATANNSAGNNTTANNSSGNNTTTGGEDMGDTSNDDDGDSDGGDDDSGGCASAGSTALPSLSLLLGFMLFGWARRREDA